MVRLLGIVVWSVGLLVTAMIVFPGLPPARALGGLGLVSIAVGLAFKDIFENFFAGILMRWRFPFENGDYIECGGIEVAWWTGSKPVDTRRSWASASRERGYAAPRGSRPTRPCA